jgi:hypothetical protein
LSISPAIENSTAIAGAFTGAAMISRDYSEKAALADWPFSSA